MTFADPIATDLEQSRTRILEVAERYFRRIGYHKTSVADIAAELGMSRANIYRFPRGRRSTAPSAGWWSKRLLTSLWRSHEPMRRRAKSWRIS
ncbi:TetR/AcrR family transcriptional regulator [Rhizobium leguminosarum]|uniref:TetR/AcrR family transcriptional regulator n=1 Tax=Rhizobium leguminosarum TaxID=384 RepID=UPI0026C9A495